MSPRALALDWSLDGPVGAAFLVALIAVAALYLGAAARGRRLDRRGRRWPRDRTACFLAGLAVLAVDLYSGIGTEADARLSVHMVEHTLMWVVVAPLLVAGAPVRLALYSLPREHRRRLGRWLRSPALAAVTGPVGSVLLFSTVIVTTHLPGVSALTLGNDYAHAAEHGLYLLTAILVWAPLLGVDPLPHRPGPRGQALCMLACMAAMGAVAIWLGSASHAVYDHYRTALGSGALHDQRLAATIMWVGGLPAMSVPALRRLWIPRRRRGGELQAQRVPAIPAAESRPV